MPRALINEVNLYFETYDFTPHWQPARTPVLFIHGLGVDHTIWLRQIGAFGSLRPMLVFDSRGHGRSDKPDGGDYAIQTHADDIAGLLDSVGFATAHVVGTSMGGKIAQQLAVRHPARIKSLTLVGTSCEPAIESNLDYRLKMFDEAEDLASLYVPIVEKSLGPATSREVYDLILALELQNPRSVLRACNVASFSYSGCDALRQVTAPALVLVGELDGSAPPYCSERLVSLIANARLAVIPNTGHAPYLDMPDEFNRIILDYLDEVERC